MDRSVGNKIRRCSAAPGVKGAASTLRHGCDLESIVGWMSERLAVRSIVIAVMMTIAATLLVRCLDLRGS